MMNGRRQGVSVLALAVLITIAGRPGTAAEAELRAVTAFPRAIAFTASFLRFVEKVNAAGRGVVRIRYLGGPEVVPQSEQPGAVRRGVVDMQYGPASYYLGLVPEGDALVGSNRTPMETRANGGLKLLQEIFRRRLAVHVLGHFDGGVGFHIYLRKPPRRTPDGGVDLKGVRLRSQPIYREFFAGLGAQTISVPVSEAHSAFSRGLVDGTGWVQTDLTAWGWQKFLRYRIDPPFFQSELLALINLKRWQGLSDEARAVLTRVAVRHERESYARFQHLIAEEDARERAAGIAVITLTGAGRARFLDKAYAAPWSRLRARAPDRWQELRSKFFLD